MDLNQNSKITKEKEYPIAPFDIAGFGPQCQIVFNLNTFFIKEVGHDIHSLTDFSSHDLIGRTIFYFLDSIVVREHLSMVNIFFNHAINYLREQRATQKFVNLDFEIRTMQGEIKRMLFQFRNFESAKGEQLAYGMMIDFSHFMLGGLPKIIVMERDGRIDGKFKVDSNVLGQTGIDLSKKEIDVLLLKSRGMRAKEIALELGVSNLSVYSVIRDVKKRTGMDLVPLIVHLKNSGVIN